MRAILIVNQIPKKCVECRFCYKYGKDKYTCTADDKFRECDTETAKRPLWCPLVEIKGFTTDHLIPESYVMEQIDILRNEGKNADELDKMITKHKQESEDVIIGIKM